MLPDTIQFRRLRLGERRKDDLDEALLVKLVSALVVGDIQVCLAALLQAQGLAVNSQVRTPFGGASIYPLQAAVCAPLEPPMALLVAQRLLELGAGPDIRWRDCGGEHTPLSKALVLRNFQLAQLLWQKGADCTTALLRTDLLESSRFDPGLVKWLLDRGADVATPLRRGAGLNPCSGLLSCQANSGSCPSSGGSDGGECATSCCCLPVPAVALVLQKLQRELHASRQLTKLHAAAGTGNEQWVLLRAAEALELLLAAGAAAVGEPDPSGTVAAAVGSMQPADWAVVKRHACCPLQWSPASHHLFPRAYRRAAREVLLVGRRGFDVPIGGGGSGRERGRPQQPRTVFWLDGNVVLNIVRHLAPCSQM